MIIRKRRCSGGGGATRESVITLNHSHQHDRYWQPLHSRNFKAGGLDMQGIYRIGIIYNEQFLAFLVQVANFGEELHSWMSGGGQARRVVDGKQPEGVVQVGSIGSIEMLKGWNRVDEIEGDVPEIIR